MRYKILPLIFGAFLTTTFSFAQGTCGTYEGSFEEQVQKYPNFYKSLEQKNADLAQMNKLALHKMTRTKNTDEKRIIPVVVHIIHDMGAENLSDVQIKNALDALNKNINGQSDNLLDLHQNTYPKTPDIFAARRGDANIEFRLAKIDPSGNPTTGIVRVHSELTNVPENRNIVKSLSYWNSYQYLNIWVVGDLPDDPGSILLGYAQFPWGGSMSTDGVVLISSQMKSVTSTTLTHEVGHWLGLRHIWGDATCGDDNVEDTPTHRESNGSGHNTSDPTPTPALFPYHVGMQNLGCVADSLNPAGEMFMNYMDYTNDNYCTMFSKGQNGVMDFTLAGDEEEFGFREWMWSAENLDSTGTSDAFKPTPCSGSKDIAERSGEYTICLGEDNDFATAIAYANATYSWNFGDGNTSTDVMPNHEYQNPGTYNVALTLNYDEEITIASTNLADLDLTNATLDSVVNILLEQDSLHKLINMGATNIVLHLDIDSLSIHSHFEHLPVDSMDGEHSSTYFGIDTFLLVFNTEFGVAMTAEETNRMNMCDITWTLDSIIASQNTATLEWEYDTLTFYFGEYSSDAYDAYFMDTLFYRGNRTETVYSATYTNSCDATITKENFIIINSITASNIASSYTYSFESESDFDSAWAVRSNGDTETTWGFNTAPSNSWEWTDKAAAKGSASLVMIGSDNLSTGTDELISEAYDLSNFTSPAVKFSYSGASSNTFPTNVLNVQYSYNCGKNWLPLGDLTELEVANAGLHNNSFIPDTSDWDEVVFSKSNLGQDNIFFKFEFVTNGSGNNFYIDNIQIGEEADLLLSSTSTMSRLSVYPNPTAGAATIALQNLEDRHVEVVLVNILGAEIQHLFSGDVISNYQRINADLSQCEKGIYFVKVVANGNIVTTDKLILSK